MKKLFCILAVMTGTAVFSSCGGDDKDKESPAAPDYTKIVFNELNGANMGETSPGKFIELYNKGDKPVSLKGVMFFKDVPVIDSYLPNGTKKVPEKDGGQNAVTPVWIGQEGMTLAAHGYLALWADADKQVPAKGYDWGFNSGFSPKKSVQMVLTDPNRVVIDVFTRGSLPVPPAEWGDEGVVAVDVEAYEQNTSFARCPDGTGAFKMARASFGTANPASSAINIP